MATLQEMLEITGNLESAEYVARTLSDNDPKYLLDLQLVLSAQGKIDEAWEVNTQLWKKEQTNRVAFNQGWLHLQRGGDLLTGFELIEKGRDDGLYGKPCIPTNKPMWNGKDDISGKTILFHCECGLGDEIICVRFVKDLLIRGAKVIIGCSKELLSVFNRIEGISAVIDKEVDTVVYHDYWIPSMSSIKILGISYNTLSGEPYLTVDPEYTKRWKEIIKKNGKLKVGIRWAGNPRYEKELWRTVPPEQLVETTNLEDVQLYSFQRDNNLIDLPDNVIDLRDILPTFEDTIAAMNEMDLMISACTCIPHMAGAIGQKTWVMVPLLSYYPWARHSDTTPWYNSVEIFRQERFQDWNKPLDEIRGKLCDLI